MKKYAIGFSLLALFGAGALATPALAADEAPAAKTEADANDKLIVTDIKQGDGDVAENNKEVTVQFAVWEFDAKAPDNKGKLVFDAHRRKPYSFILGHAEVIDGWDQGLPGMKVGGVRRLVVPRALGFGSHGAGPDAKLVFDLELLKVAEPKKEDTQKADTPKTETPKAE